jgi:peptide/nickel transport system permease protein
MFAVVMLAAFGPVVSNDPFTQHLVSRLEPPLWAGGADHAHIFGTDSLGRDVFARIVFGARISLLISLLAVLISGTLGTLIGVYSGYYGGWLDTLMMRLADIQLAFPFILLVILLVGTLGPSLINVVMVLGISGWVLYARIVRGQTLSLREKEFVEASRALGMGDARIIFRHILPNVMSTVIVIASFATAQMIIAEASLSFLGLGVQPPNPSLGGMLSEGKIYIVIDPWVATLPGLTIMVAVLGVNLLGDWLRDLLDPRELTRTA